MEDRRHAVSWDRLVARTAERASIPKKQVELVLESFIDTVKGAVTDLESVRLKGLGTLSTEWSAARVLRSPRDRKKMYLDGRHRVRFRVAAPLRRALTERSPQHWRDAAHQSAWRLAETLVSDLELYHRDLVPRGLGDLSPEECADRIAQAFGHHWRRAVQTFETSVAPEVRRARDHLIEAAKLRWGDAHP